MSTQCLEGLWLEHAEESTILANHLGSQGSKVSPHDHTVTDCVYECLFTYSLLMI